MPREPDQIADVMRGLNLAWALAHVPGTALIIIGGALHAFCRDTNSSRAPCRRGIAQSAPASVGGVPC